MGIVVFFCWVGIVATIVAFLLSLCVKFGLLEWLQVHAPNAFFEKLFNCKFCCSFWASLLISLILSLTTGQWELLAVPVCSTIIARELW